MSSDMTPAPAKPRRAWRAAAALALLAAGLWLAATGRHHCLLPGRHARLMCAINANTGFAHLTRGMNMDTIAALDAAATEEDIPALQELLFGKDRVAAMTAAEVLAKKGPKSRAALEEAFKKAGAANDSPRAMLIREHGGLEP